MIIERNFTGVLRDNDEQYFHLLEGVLSSVDEYASLTVSKAPKQYIFRIIPSNPTLINLIITELIKLHNILQIKLSFSKSIKNSASISYHLNIFEQ